MKKFRDAIGRGLTHPASFGAATMMWLVHQASNLPSVVSGARRDADGQTGEAQYRALVTSVERLEKLNANTVKLDERLADATDPDLAPTYPEGTVDILQNQRMKLRYEFESIAASVPVDVILSRGISSQDAFDLGNRIAAIPHMGYTLPPAAGSNALRRCQDLVPNEGPRAEAALKIAACLKNPPRQKSDVTAGFTFAALTVYGIGILAVRRRKATAVLRRPTVK